jgi:hypothetical protein
VLRVGVVRLLASLPIGALVALASPSLAVASLVGTAPAAVAVVVAQDPAAAAGLLPAQGPLREALERLLLAPAPDLAAGWQLALDLGRPALPPLRDLLQRQGANVKHRLVTLAALLLAAGLGEDDVATEFLAQARQKPMLEERTLVAMMVALGPQRARPVPDFAGLCLGPIEPSEPLLAVAVRLAAARLPGAAAGLIAAPDDDVGELAAAAFAGMPLPASALARLRVLRSGERHADLFWRGWLLGLARQPTKSARDAGLELARELSRQRADSLAAAQSAAVWLRVRADDFDFTSGERLDLPLLRVAAGSLPPAPGLAALLPSQPLPRDERPERLAVAWALATPFAQVVVARDRWAAQPAIAEHVTLALAWRAGAEPGPLALPSSAQASWQLVRFAAGQPIDGTAVGADAGVRTLLQLAADGRLTRPALRRALEGMLWERGSHPGLAAFDLERELLRDLLLAGSNYGGGKYAAHVPPDQRYSPTGLDRNDGFFRIAVALFDFLARPRAPVPPEHRLP